MAMNLGSQRTDKQDRRVSFLGLETRHISSEKTTVLTSVQEINSSLRQLHLFVADNLGSPRTDKGGNLCSTKVSIPRRIIAT